MVLCPGGRELGLEDDLVEPAQSRRLGEKSDSRRV